MVEFIAIFGSALLYGALHSWLASHQAKRAARRMFGPPADRVYRLAYNVIGVLTLVPVLALAAAMPDRPLYAIPAPWVWLTGAAQLAAGLALLVGVLQTGLFQFAGLSQLAGAGDETPGALVTSGLYRWVRHPLYTAGMVFIWLSPVMTRSLLALYAGLTVYLIVGAYIEERKLAAEYGDAYREYRRRTPMFIPFLR